VTTAFYDLTEIVEGQGQQGITVNTALQVIDRALGGYLVKSVAGGANVTLTSVEWQYKLFSFTGTLTASISVIVPNKSRLFVVHNNTTGSYSLTVKTVAGVGFPVPQGQRVVLECDAVDVYPLTAGGTGGSGTGNYGITFSGVPSVTVSAIDHGFTDANIVVAAYDASGNEFTPNSKSVHPSTFAVTVGFGGINMTGRLVLNGTGGVGGGSPGGLSNPVTVPQGGTAATSLTGLLVGNGTSPFTALTTSAALASIISDDTGSGSLVFNTSPTFLTSIIDPLVIGGVSTGSTLLLRATSGVGAAGMGVGIQVGNNGNITALQVLNSGFVGVGGTPVTKFHVQDAVDVESRISSSVTNKTLRFGLYDGGTVKGRVDYEGSNSAGNRWVGLICDSADYLLLGAFNNVPIQLWVNSLEVARYSATGLLMAPTVDVTIPNIKAATGENHVTIDTNGKLLSSPVQAAPRIVLLGDATSITPSFLTADQNNQTNTQAAGTLTFNAPASAPADGKSVIVVIQSTNAQALAFNAIYRFSTDLPQPTTMPAGTNYFIFAYRSGATKYDLLSKVFGY
jgi:hypothetical protein